VTAPDEWDPDRYAAFDRLELDLRPYGVLLMTLRNDGKLNATDAQMHAQLARVFRVIDDDPHVGAVVVTGAGRAFSAGGDLEWIAEQVGDYGRTMQVMREAGDIVRTMIECDTPVVSAINGSAPDWPSR
jgi:enoyl-CoA hydratase